MKYNTSFTKLFTKNAKAVFGQAAIVSIILALAACGETDNAKSQVTTNAVSSVAQNEPKPEPKTDTPTNAQTQTDTQAQTNGEPTHNTASNKDNQASADPQVLAIGKARYETTCQLCHTQGLLNSPKLSDKTAWQPRLNKGIATLQQNAIQGFGKMPAQAVDGVSEEEVRAAVDYMVSQVQN